MKRLAAWRDAGLSYLRLCKPGISLLASGSALAGAALASGRVTARFFIPWLGVPILASGAGALNQVQECDLDARMERTRRRPVPSRNIQPGRARTFACPLIGNGLLILAADSPIAALLGALAVAWYN